MQNTNSSSKGYLFPLVVIGILFFMIGFALGINGLIIPFLRTALDLTTAESYLVLAATFSTFIIFGYPSGLVIKAIGYKKTMILSFLFFAIGLYLFIPSAENQSFAMFLLASFISGIGNTMLQAAVNPYITILGPLESAATRMSMMGIANKAAWAIAPIFLGIFLNLGDVKLEDIKLPFYFISGIFVLLGILVAFVPLPEVKAEGEDENDEAAASSYAANKTSIWQFPHLLLGLVSLLFYVGVETLAMASIVDYATSLNLPDPQVYTSYTVIGMVIGYLVGVFFIPKYISQERAMFVCAIIGLISSLLIVLTPMNISIWFVAVLGLANSLMWPALWPMAMKDLGKFTKTGSSLLVMAIVGGAVFPLLFGWLADVSGNMQQAYWICFPAYLMIFYYALSGHKIRI
ncbi:MULTISPECIES: glucose/galactose MFS transporter [Parabacteroides]|jgi:FHS family L-fucose permease-like MFS transporter|uniref:Glucose/galactose transporter warning n=1 Tax=Parabacteroides gordonii MS-1 = DSM 23371 TaxID=1203610 RepID=A0A0F5J880_9BACT|nr:MULTISPECIES: glucose/galactose MFS transporter [Parabacteroides]KKB49719.1 glucose/galactose transporter warning [Parabacteroides sp. HGS0025]KKB53948.1 glucose/galactose transporter warning [Parabacteroides gordonii MS-1 = DSM 23371]MCA5584769.1 glucose/galactose MFS transporter [Parabacteroides gordonii]RGP14059.1 glucose/galactose MFS transporter [Parabacteroides gordonii]